MKNTHSQIGAVGTDLIAKLAILGGFVEVGERSLIGMGVTVYFRVKIGQDVTVRNGSSIFSDVRNQSFVKS